MVIRSECGGNMGTKLIGIISALVGTTLITVTGMVREGINIESYNAIADENAYTILVYMNGSDLESNYEAATEDLEEMEKALSSFEIESDIVRIVVEAGGSTSWEYEVMKEAEYGRFCITSEGVSNFTELEMRNMGEADTLTDFLNYGMEAYPAEHYILIFWNHGSGSIYGYGSDSNYEYDSLTLSEMSTAFEQADMDSVFDLISFDACLMGTIETVATLSDYTSYLTASPELEPEQGYDYTWLGVFDDMEAGNELDTIEIGNEILKTYIAYYEEEDYELILTLVDMSQYEEFEVTLEAIMRKLFDTTTEDESLYQYLGEERQTMLGFGNESGLTTTDIVDVMDMLSKLGEYIQDEELMEQLNVAYSELVIAVASSNYIQDISGLSIYLPSGSNEELIDDTQVYEEIGFSESYKEFVETYTAFLISETEIEWATLEIEEKEITATISEDSVENITAAYLVTFARGLNENEVYLISTDSDVSINRNGTLKAMVEEEFWGLQGQCLCMIEVIHTQNYTEYMVPILYNGEQCNMMIEFTTECPDGKITDIVSEEVNKQIYTIKEGDIIVPLYPSEEITDISIEETYAENIYMDSYYMGSEIVIDNLEAGDDELALVSMEEELLYGFMVIDNKQMNYYAIEFALNK